MNLSRKHKKHLNTVMNYGSFKDEELMLTGMRYSWDVYILAERMARNRKPHRVFRKVIKKGGIL